jgi:hypothetical protein
MDLRPISFTLYMKHISVCTTNSLLDISRAYSENEDYSSNFSVLAEGQKYPFSQFLPYILAFIVEV